MTSRFFGALSIRNEKAAQIVSFGAGKHRAGTYKTMLRKEVLARVPLKTLCKFIFS